MLAFHFTLKTTWILSVRRMQQACYLSTLNKNDSYFTPMNFLFCGLW